MIFFCKYSPEFGINIEHDFLNNTNISHNTTETAIYKYENRHSVIAIKNI